MNGKIKKITCLVLLGSSFLFLLISCSGIENILNWQDRTADNKDKHLTQFVSHVRPHPGNPDSHYLLACYYQERGKHKEALKEFEKVLFIDPNYVKAYNGIGVSYDLLGDFARANEYYRYALKLDPNLSYVYNNFGYSCLLQGNLDEAITAFKKAIAVSDQDQLFHNNLALAYAEKGQYDLALAEFKIAGDEAKAHYNMAQLYFKIGLFDEAKNHYAIALKLNPSLTVVRTALKAADALAKIFEPIPSNVEPKQLVLPDQTVIKEEQVEKVVVAGQSPIGKELGESISSDELGPLIVKQKELIATDQAETNKKVSEQLVASNLSNNVSQLLDFQKTDSTEKEVLYQLQVASFRLKENAIHAARSIQQLGYETAISPTEDGNNERWYRIIVGPFEASDEVLTFKDRIGKKYKFNPIVLRKTKERSALEKVSHLKQVGEKERLLSLNGVGIEISNGNGAYRMARKVSDYLKEKGFKVTRLTNANNFNHLGTRIFYQKKYDEAADHVAGQLPVFRSKEETEKLDRLNIKIKILIGKDMIPHQKIFENGKNS